jgi:hypothetical protein
VPNAHHSLDIQESCHFQHGHRRFTVGIAQTGQLGNRFPSDGINVVNRWQYMGQCLLQCVPPGDAQIQIDIPKEGILLEFLEQIDDRRAQVTANKLEIVSNPAQ